MLLKELVGENLTSFSAASGLSNQISAQPPNLSKYTLLICRKPPIKPDKAEANL